MFLTKKGKIDIKISIYDFLYTFLPMKKRFRIDKTEILGVKKKTFDPDIYPGREGHWAVYSTSPQSFSGLNNFGDFYWFVY